MKDRSAYAQEVIAAGDRYRKEGDSANADYREALKLAHETNRARMDKALHVYDEELKAAAIKYGREEAE